MRMTEIILTTFKNLRLSGVLVVHDSWDEERALIHPDEMPWVFHNEGADRWSQTEALLISYDELRGKVVSGIIKGTITTEDEIGGIDWFT